MNGWIDGGWKFGQDIRDVTGSAALLSVTLEEKNESEERKNDLGKP